MRFRVLTVVVAAATGVIINLASEKMPDWLSLPWILWPGLVILTVVAMVVGPAQDDRDRGGRTTQESELVVVDASLDDRLSLGATAKPEEIEAAIKQIDENGRLESDTTKIVDSEYVRAEIGLNAYGALDFKFLNRGPVTAVLHHFDIEVLTFEPDLNPALHFSYSAREYHDAVGKLPIEARNDGWGPANDCCVTLTDPVLARLLPASDLTTQTILESDAKARILQPTLKYLDVSGFRDLADRRRAVRDEVLAVMHAEDPTALKEIADYDLVFSKNERYRVDLYFEYVLSGKRDPIKSDRIRDVAQITGLGVPIEPTLTASYANVQGITRSVDATAYGPGVQLWLTADRFAYQDSGVRFYSARYTEAVAVVLEPRARQYPKYRISRVVAPGESDRFHVLIAARQSGHYVIRTVFYTDAERPTVSPPVRLYLRRDRNEYLPAAIKDGARFEIEKDQLVLGTEPKSY